MKKIFLSGWICISLSLAGWAQQYSFQSLLGKWEAEDGGGIEAIDSARIFLVYGADKKAIISYKADFTKSPCWFDFDVKDSTQTLHLKSLLLFVNADTLQWEIFEDGVRPDNFTPDKGDMVYLKRKK
jgi:hypothetical protein